MHPADKVRGRFRACTTVEEAQAIRARYPKTISANLYAWKMAELSKAKPCEV